MGQLNGLLPSGPPGTRLSRAVSWAGLDEPAPGSGIAGARNLGVASRPPSLYSSPDSLKTARCPGHPRRAKLARR
jgi:hypothetical protein